MENQLSSAKKRNDQAILEDDDFDVRRIPADAEVAGEGTGGLEFKADREAAKGRSGRADQHPGSCEPEDGNGVLGDMSEHQTTVKQP